MAYRANGANSIDSPAYRPYRSDSEDSLSDWSTESDISSASDSTTSEYARRVQPLEGPNFRVLAQGLSLTKLGGGNAIDPSGNNYLEDILPGYTLTSGYPTFKNYEVAKDPSGGEIKSSSQSVNSIIMLDSTNRDRSVYPQPTNVTLRLPRVYSNITSFQLVQIKFLSAFYYFRADKANTSITIQELDRTVTDICGNVSPDPITSYIREGTYDINSLLTELTTRLNVTPIFYDFPNGFQDFAPRFAATGDYSIGFNYPGDFYYDALLKTYIANPTLTTILSKYFQGQYAGRSSYTTDEMKVAYYYPVLKEYILDTTYVSALPLNLTLTTSAAYLLPAETVYSRIVYTFQGIDDPVILEVINTNTAALDLYRVRHTFRYALINKYIVNYETQSNKVTFYTPSLNTSLVSLINYKQSQSLAEQLNKLGIDQATYNNYKTQNTILLAVLNDMFYMIERWLAVYYGVSFNTFTIDYMANPNNILPLRDAYQAVGISSNFDSNVIYRKTPATNTSLLAPLQRSAPEYWNRMTDLPEPTLAFPYNLETGNSSTSSNYPYSVLLEQQDREHKFVDASGYLYANRLTRYADILVPIEPAKYTVFKFKSPVRQSLQIETLPRPTAYRYPAYNAITYDLSAQKLFDNSYCFIENAQNAQMDITADFQQTSMTVIPGFSTTQTNFGQSYSESIADWGSNFQKLQVGDTRKFFELRAPYPPGYESIQAPAYRYPLSVSLASLSTVFVTPMNMYLYHDRGGFMADISSNGHEIPFNYLTMVSTTTDSNATLTFPVYANQRYYVMARSVSQSIATQTFRVVPWFPEGLNYTALTSSLVDFDPLADPSTPAALSNFNYAVEADPAYIRLPIQTSLQNPSIHDVLFSNLTFSNSLMGYDVNGVSTDLTDYCGFIANNPTGDGYPTSILRADPINRYIFQVQDNYDPVAQQYITVGGSNAILLPDGAGIYTPGTIPAREYTNVHWYGTTYLANSENQAPMTSNLITSSNAIAPFITTTTNVPLSGYTYAGSNQSIQLGDGVAGISFIPAQGVWDIQRMMFKSVYITGDPETDENLNILYVGVYYSAITTNRYVHEIELSNAIAVLKFSKAVTYTSNTLDLGFDAAGGTYYEFLRDPTFSTGSNSYVYGYSQITEQVNLDINAIYSFIPFTSGQQVATFDGLVGSPVPYPYYSDAIASNTYLDGSRTPTGVDLVVPRIKASPDTTRGPPAGYDQSQSQYEQSPPIGTNLFQYIVPYPFASLSNAMKPWQPLPYAPAEIIADVSGYILTEDSFYRVFQYSSDTTNYSLTEKYQFTLDQIYSQNDPAINFIGAAANEYEYAFFAYSNTTPSMGMSNKILIRTMNPADGTLRQTSELVNLPEFDPASQKITNLTYNNFGGFTFALKSPSTITALCKHSASNSTMTIVSGLDLSGYNSNVDRFITRQSPKEEYGKFSIFPYRTGLSGAVSTGITDYITATPSNVIGSPDPSYKYNSYTGEQNQWSSTDPTKIDTINLITSNISSFNNPIITRQPYKDYIYMLSEYDRQRFYEVRSWTTSSDPMFTSNAAVLTSVYQFPAPTSNLIQGGNGAKWSVIGNILYGNRNDVVDSPRKIHQAWQLFYPMIRIVFRQISKNFTFMNTYDKLKYPEYPHTAILGYTSYNKMVEDISGRWGLESSSNFEVADFSFLGTNFNGFVYSFPLEPSTPANPYNYLAIRGYSPTEKSQVLMRMSLTNNYDYGYIALKDLSGEVPLIQTSPKLFNPDYLLSLSNFNSKFIIDSNGKAFGANVIAGYPGSNLSNVTGFGDFYGHFINLYTQYNAQVQLVQNINSNVNAYVTNFIQTDLQNILPPSALNRQRFTDPLTFSILWKSSLLPQYAKLEEQWGMGWNLGFNKLDTSYQTVQTGSSFFKILDDFINLQLNREFDMNRMDTGAKENLALTQETTGATKAFHGKLLLAPFGSYAQTLVSNPISFYPPLGRMDKLTFTWVDITGATLNNADCEWNAVVQIVEKKDMTEIVQAPRIDPTARSMKK